MPPMGKRRKTDDIHRFEHSEHAGEDRAAAGSRKKAAASRIGRACDRCQVRSMFRTQLSYGPADACCSIEN